MPLRVTIEIVPHGVESAKRKLATIEIINDLTGTPDLGNYLIHAEGERDDVYERFFKGKVIGVPRGDYLSCVIACMKAIDEGRNEIREAETPKMDRVQKQTGKEAESPVRGARRRRGK